MNKKPIHKVLLVLFDWILLTCSFAISSELHSRILYGIWIPTASWWSVDSLYFGLYSAFIILIFQQLNLYLINIWTTVVDQSIQIIKSLLVAVLGLSIISFFTKAHIFIESRFSIFLYFLVSSSLVVTGRLLLFRPFLAFLSNIRVYERPVMIIGAAETAKFLAANILFSNLYGLRIVGFIDDKVEKGTPIFSGLRVIGKQKEIPALASLHSVAEILICLERITHDKLLEILELCSGTNADIKIASPLFDIIPEKIITEKYGNIPVVGFTTFQPTSLRQTVKRVLDFSLAMVGILLIFPLFLIVAILIKLDSPGPVFFRQVRVGKNGKLFELYKFRSMVVGSDADANREKNAIDFVKGRIDHAGVPTKKIVNDSKITRMGKILRKTSIDELPQLYNVIRGEMSLVGPRPCLPYEWDHYEEWHKKRSLVTPGCTGVWQVSGRSEVGFEDMVILDLYYVHNVSLALDFKIILKTFPVMLFGRGAK